MSVERELQKRSNSKCELCQIDERLSMYLVAPRSERNLENCVYLCSNCTGQIEDPKTMDANHWRCLNDSIWSTIPAIQVLSWRLLHRLRSEGWPQDLLDMMYMEDETFEWAKETGEGEKDENAVIHRDSNGVILKAGDSVVLIKDLKVKGSSMIAKQGTAVRRISLDHDNAEYIEGKVDGINIVIITQYVKKL
ncbi:MAG: PhnA domain-containing protein [Bacteroidia bacterium]|nr:PhnA domain-containing protein [Bacteroidia bacterium]NND25514.1 PhnA protein [Flavobacteriaceae bacterium]MBT8278408.1 PhnA domain-containing protein [Bacteroidia bacterium]NNK60569.1 PhnA protein [Flavobacteriaceae bacterium]NNL31588.1 PhnA protein [Flavobacteriaceae bacterium]